MKQGPFIHYKTCNNCSNGACHCLLFYCTVSSSSFLFFLGLHELSNVCGMLQPSWNLQTADTYTRCESKAASKLYIVFSVHPTHLEAASDQVMQWLRVQGSACCFGPGDSATVNASKHRQFWVRCNHSGIHINFNVGR